MPQLTIQEALRTEPSLPPLDREVLLAYVLKRDRAWLMAHPEYVLSATQEKRFRSLLARAKQHEPIAYITGEREFYGHGFFVNRHTLIPRPETELLIEAAFQSILKFKAQNLRKENRIAIVDIGTGSGNIIISLAKEISRSSLLIRRTPFQFFATDISSPALRIAQKNAKRLGVGKNIVFAKSDLLSALQKKLSAFDELLIVANLPYLSNALYRSTAPNVKHYEPKNALVSGKNGLSHYRRLMIELKALNATGVRINFFLEISPEQVKRIPSILTNIVTLSSLEIIPDLAGKSRLVIGVLENSQNKSPA